MPQRQHSSEKPQAIIPARPRRPPGLIVHLYLAASSRSPCENASDDSDHKRQLRPKDDSVTKLVTLRNALMTAALLRRAVQGRLKIAGSADFDAFVSSWLRLPIRLFQRLGHARATSIPSTRRTAGPARPTDGEVSDNRKRWNEIGGKPIAARGRYHAGILQRRLVSDLLATPSPSTGGRQGAVSGWSGGILRGAFKALSGEPQLKQSPLPVPQIREALYALETIRSCAGRTR